MTIETTTPLWTGPRKAILAALMTIQLAIAIVIGTGGFLTNDMLSVIPPIAITATAPVILFLLAYAFMPGFRAFVLAQDLRKLTMIQHWRVLGFAFLLLYAHGVLPGLFAWPAGVGDVAVGFAAFFVVARMDRDPDYATSRGLVWFHIMGLTDFAVAVVTVGLAAGAYPALIGGGVTSAAMDVWPLNIFPSFGVPAFIIVQAAALLKIRHLRRVQAAHVDIALVAA